jgi:uncharacterized protein (TIGR00661 family)
VKILFIVQGEGRGHLTQAIALSQILAAAGHEIAGALVGRSEGRTIPNFFHEQINAPVYHFEGLHIVYGNGGDGMHLGRTVRTHLRKLPTYLKSLGVIDRRIKTIKPDLIINFYEILSGLHRVLYPHKIPTISIAHQYLLLHPDFIFPSNSRIDRFLINLNSRATSFLNDKTLALSFRSLADQPDRKMTVVPPLLRQQIKALKPVKGNFILIYLTHHSLSQQIINWHNAHPEFKLHCFWDNHQAAQELPIDENLTFHRINSEKYLRMLATCKALVTTAGFESVCEAMYLGKPVMMVPVPNHFEQACNAVDGVISGAGLMANTFDLSLLLDYLPKHQDQSEKFRRWQQSGKQMFLKEVENFVKGKIANVPADMAENHSDLSEIPGSGQYATPEK